MARNRTGPGLEVPPETRRGPFQCFNWNRPMLSPEGRQQLGSGFQCPEPQGTLATDRQVT